MGPTRQLRVVRWEKTLLNRIHSAPRGQMPDAPIGRGGKTDDTSCVVAEVIEWTEAHSKVWRPRQRRWQWPGFMACGAQCAVDEEELDDYEGSMRPHGYKNPRVGRDAKFNSNDDDEEDDSNCCIA
mmetsp:Transcript_23798/g.80419  ORF Transcript_23798/g.80419 Transcript_23798/m.80419 type:complete len:126 (+) Transcript_23798:271-648(+)